MQTREIFIRTPLRASLFGGGSDMPRHYQKHSGYIISTAIDRFIDVIIRVRNDSNFRVITNSLEVVDNPQRISHPIVREAVCSFKPDVGLDICIISDVTRAGSGLGASSALTVGLIKGLHTISKRSVSKLELVKQAYDLEAVKVGRCIGQQDFFPAVYGGFNKISIDRYGVPKVTKLQPNNSVLSEFVSKFILLDTRMRRDAASVLSVKVNTKPETKIVNATMKLVELGMMFHKAIIGGDSSNFYEMFDEAWALKKETGALDGCPEISDIFTKAKKMGALSGRLLGAGSGGHMLFFVPEELQVLFIQEFETFKPQKLNSYTKGSQNLLCNNIRALNE